MKKIFLVTSLMVAVIVASAQQKNIRVGVSLDVVAPLGNFSDFAGIGFGGSARGVFAVGKTGDITLTTGYYNLGWKDLDPEEKGSSYIIPVVLGYRHHFSKIFVEPFAGYGNYGEHYSNNFVDENASVSALAWGGGAGYSNEGIEAGIRYLGLTHEGTLSTISIYVGYNFPLRSERK
jgi:hypothetical protein